MPIAMVVQLFEIQAEEIEHRRSKYSCRYRHETEDLTFYAELTSIRSKDLPTKPESTTRTASSESAVVTWFFISWPTTARASL